MVANPKNPKDWASIIAVVFVLSLLGIYFANAYVADFALSTQMFIFIIILGVGFFAGVRLLGLSTGEKQLKFEDLAILGGVIYGLYWVLTKYNIAPEFSIALRHTMSLIGLG